MHIFFSFQAELTCHCPRCKIEIPKSKLNQHMDQVHGIKIFNQLMKRSFQPDTPSNFPMKIARPFLDSDPLALSKEEFNNNDIIIVYFLKKTMMISKLNNLSTMMLMKHLTYQVTNMYAFFCLKMFDLINFTF